MKLMVIDGNSILNRAFYGVRLLSNRDGLYTNAVYGFLSILFRLLDERAPDALCVCFDLKAPTFRHLSFEGYKSRRTAMPEELQVQMPVVKEVLDAMHIARFELEGFEADDLIGTISRRSDSAGWDCEIVTGDRDSLQLVSDRVKSLLVSTVQGQTQTKEYTPARIKEEYGLTPAQIIDLKGLMGDKSDDIPGVAGVGEKTALELVRNFGSIEEIYQRLDTLDIRESVRNKLRAGSEMAAVSRRLATIDCDTPIDFSPEKALLREPDNDMLYQLFIKLEFKTFMNKLKLGKPQDAPKDAPKDALAFILPPHSPVSGTQALDKLIAACAAEQAVGFACAQSLDALALSTADMTYTVCRADHDEQAYERFLHAVFSDKIKKAGHDLRPLFVSLMAQGFCVDGFMFDAALGAYLLNPSESGYTIEKTALRLLSLEIPPSGAYDAENAFSPLSDRGAALDAIAAHAAVTFEEYKRMAPELEKLEMKELYYSVELPLCQVLADMQHTGFKVDKSRLTEFQDSLGRRMEDCEKRVYALAGGPFNINSTKQLGQLLFETLELPAVKKNKTGYSTDIDVLEKLKSRHPIIEQIIEYRQLSKLKSTYADGLLKVIRPDGKIHSSFNMTATTTGRISSTDPNLQNIPIRQDLGSEVRRMFIAGQPDWVLIDADYSQIELRILAHIAKDPVMIRAFESGEDIHTVTASQVFNVPVEEVTSLMRRNAKAVNFGIVYGISEFSLSEDIGVSRAEARRYMDNYLEKYAGVRTYMKEIVERAKRDGYVTTLMGRRRYLPELKSSNYNIRSFGERVALNTPIQGSAADIIKLAMVNVWHRLKKEGFRAKLILQVHDELIVEAPLEEAQAAKRLLVEEMESAMHLSVALLADASDGYTWYDAKK